MSIERKPVRDPKPEILDKIADLAKSVQDESPEDEELDEALRTLKAEFVRVAEGVNALESVPLSEANYEKIRLIGERISALAEISPDLSGRPDIRVEYDQAVLYIASAYLETVGKKFAESGFGNGRQEAFAAYLAIREKLERSLKML